MSILYILTKITPILPIYSQLLVKFGIEMPPPPHRWNPRIYGIAPPPAPYINVKNKLIISSYTEISLEFM